MTIIIGLICLGILIFIHETGHFCAARLFGVKVESFSIGMGPLYIHKTIKGTDYRLSLLPFGGYCGMKGEKDFSNALDAGLNKIQAEKDSLYGIHPLKRALIGFAGPFFNLLFAFIAYTIICFVGYSYNASSSQIVIPQDGDSPAREAGIKTGDKILKINNATINDFSDIYTEVASCADEDIKVIVERAGETITFTVHTILNKETGAGYLGVQSNGVVELMHTPKYSFGGSIIQGAKRCGQMIYLSIKSIGVLFKGVDIKNVVSGPARMSSMLGESAQQGFSQGFKIGMIVVLEFLGIISISLFIMNLLPIPILDGGLVLFALIEFIFRHQIPPKVQLKVQYVGLFFIAALFLLGIYGDVNYFITKIKTK